MTTALRHGDRSQAVRDLQKKLNAHGANLVADGDYGDTTEAAVRAYQVKVGLVADGIAGTKTLASLIGGDCRQLLKNQELVNAAKRLDIPLASVMAVNEVESQGRGFLDNGKPVILFERHIMYRRLALPRHDGDDVEQLQQHADQLAANNPALVNQRAGGYAGGTAEHQRLAHARWSPPVGAPSRSWVITPYAWATPAWRTLPPAWPRTKTSSSKPSCVSSRPTRHC
jgi:lysozyme family protein